MHMLTQQHGHLKMGISLKGFKLFQFLHCIRAPVPGQVCKIFFAMKRCLGVPPLPASQAGKLQQPRTVPLLNTQCHHHCFLCQCLSTAAFRGFFLGCRWYHLLCKGP